MHTRRFRQAHVGRLAVALAAAALAAPLAAQAPPAAAASSAGEVTARLRANAASDPLAWERLAYLCDRIGPRLAGSAPFQQAVAWGAAAMREDHLDEVRLEPVTTELWVRGHEHAVMTAPVVHDLPMLGIGESVGTPGVEAPVVVARSFADLGPQVKGKIVLFDPVIPPAASGGARYGIYVPFRVNGASKAAAFGAVAVLVRAAPVHSLATAHTGMLSYDPAQPQIPAAIIASEYAEWIARLAAAGVEVRVRLEMGAHSAGDVETANVVGEIRGASRPQEIVLIGAHLDSWDVGQGAHDDGTGVIHVIEALRLIKALGVAPERTIRGVLFVNEEHGSDGGKAYEAAHKGERHVAAYESDSGGGPPVELGVSGTPQQLAWFLAAVKPVGLPVRFGGGGTDIAPIARDGVLASGLRVDLPNYFDIHHTQADTLDKVDPQALRDGVAATAVLAWQLANAPEP